jgi:hypothetical protein
MKSENRKTGDDLILSSIVLAGNALRMAGIAEATGLSKPTVKYWLPRMIKSGVLLSFEENGITFYEPQPIVNCPELQDALEDIYSQILDNPEEFFITDQAECSAEEVLRNNILKSLEMYSMKVRNL